MINFQISLCSFVGLCSACWLSERSKALVFGNAMRTLQNCVSHQEGERNVRYSSCLAT
jgi:hypothetical protein